MSHSSLSPLEIMALVKEGTKLPWATHSYPSRGQTATQAIYLTKEGKLFLKRVSKQNHDECRIVAANGTLSEREYWAHRLAMRLGLVTPDLWLVDTMTTVQRWLDFPDGRQYATSHGKMYLSTENVFDCSLYDWLTGQVDRHDANYLYDYVHQKIILIDSAHCFLKYTGSIPDYLKYAEVLFSADEMKKSLATQVLKNLGHLTPKEIRKVVPLRNREESKALEARLEVLKSAQCVQDVVSLYRKG